MQYVRKEDVFNQDMSVKTMVYQASILFFFCSLYLYYIPNTRSIYIYISYIIYHILYIIYIYTHTIHYRSSLFFSVFISQNYYYKSAYSRLTFYIIGTYTYRRNLPTCFIVLYVRSVALNYSLRLNGSAPEIVPVAELLFST